MYIRDAVPILESIFSSYSHFDGECWGRYSTLCCDCDLKPYSKERSEYVKNWYDNRYKESYNIIKMIFPELNSIEHIEDMGSIETWQK